MLLGFLVGWLAVVWFLPLVAHPLWILAHGLAYAVVAGPALGGSDVIRGCEEFAFAGPVTRGQRYVARLLLGGATVLAFTAMSVVALAGKLSDVLIRVFVRSAPASLELEPSLTLNALVWSVPLAVFGCGFVVRRCPGPGSRRCRRGCGEPWRRWPCCGGCSGWRSFGLGG